MKKNTLWHVYFLYSTNVDITPEIDTLILPVISLKIVSFHVLSPVRAEQILSRGGSKKISISWGTIFSKFYYFFL